MAGPVSAPPRARLQSEVAAQHTDFADVLRVELEALFELAAALHPLPDALFRELKRLLKDADPARCRIGQRALGSLIRRTKSQRRTLVGHPSSAPATRFLSAAKPARGAATDGTRPNAEVR
jgi:hypothetical protein